MKSLDQERSAYAWEQIGDKPSKEYVNLAKGAPALIMSNGLMQTLAFYRGKDKPHHRRLMEAIIGWLGRRLHGEGSGQSRFPTETNAGFDSIMSALHGCDSDLYLRATEESLEILRWIRQLAAARARAGG